MYQYEDLAPYQRFGVEQIIEKRRVALWMEPGLGKTITALTAFWQLKYFYGRVTRCLIVAPKKVAEATWEDEIDKWCHTKGMTVANLVNKKFNKRKEKLRQNADVYIVNRDLLIWLIDFFAPTKIWPFDMVVLDESTSFKDSSTKRFKKFKSVYQQVNYLVELTGTPAPESYMDLWAQVFLLDGGARLGKTITAFREKYFVPDKRSRTQIFSWKLAPGAKEQIDFLLSDICFSMMAKDYIYLPDILWDDIPVYLTEPIQVLYEKLERETFLKFPDGIVDGATAAALSTKLLQLASGNVYDDDRNIIFVHDEKILALEELVESLQGEPVLVFYNFKHEEQAIRDRFPYAVKYENDQQKIDWNDGKIKMLLAHPASCAYGLNLQQGGHHVVWYGLNCSYELTDQANRRLWRQGQKQPVIVHRLIAKGTWDEEVVQKLCAKDAGQSSLMRALSDRAKKFLLGRM